jgi:hypothetical protein
VESENPDYAGCRYNCTTDEDCDSGCCQPFANSNNGFCVDALYFSCAAIGEPCGMGPPYCCEGSHCTGSEENGFVCNPSVTKAGRELPGMFTLKLLTDDGGQPDAICIVAKHPVA